MFRLSKWYLDCVTEAGDASIAYVGEIAWGKIRLYYTSLLESSGALVRERHSLHTQSQPEIKDRALHWLSSALDVLGEWKLAPNSSSEIGIRKTIFRSQHGSIEWHCLAPNATARLGKRTGLGYAEHLTMTITPWKLPIRSLRWGRFISDSHWVVWIDWQGEHATRFVYADGDPIDAKVMEDDRIELANGARLTMDRSLVLRDGPLGTAALSGIPGLRKTFPTRLLQVQECKWRSRAQLEWLGGTTEEGWAIHERVDWPE